MFKGLFDIQFRFEKIDSNGDPLVRLNRIIDWELFRPRLDVLRDKPRKSNAGAKPYDVVLMFKILVLKSLYNLSDEVVEAQVLDRLSFMRFLGLTLADDVPDARTIWLFADAMAQAGLDKPLFEQFNTFLGDHGYAARKGQIVDASLVSAPQQHNTKEENQKIKAGQPVEGWSEVKRRHKDVDARWTRKNGRSYYGFKNHVGVDVEHKFIRDYAVTHAAVHDRHLFEQLLDPANASRDVWGDSAYSGKEMLEMLERLGYREHLQRKGNRYVTLTDQQKQLNHQQAKTRCRVEHVFGAQFQRAKVLLLRTIGLVRARCKIGLRNLVYNLERYAMLETRTA